MNGYDMTTPYSSFIIKDSASLNITGNGTLSMVGGGNIISNESTGIVTINKDITCKSSTGAPINNTSNGTVIINGATIFMEALYSPAISNSGGGLIWIKEESNITRINIKNGSVKSCTITNSNGTIRLGTDDGTVNENTPTITSRGGAITNSGTIEFYDGYISDPSSGISITGTIITPTGYSIEYTNNGHFNVEAKLSK